MFRKAFSTTEKLENFNKPLIGMRTGDNERFLRFWYEPSLNALSMYKYDSAKWFPYCKGGEFRRWYGNQEVVVYWANDGYSIKFETLKKYPNLSWDNLGWKISNEKYYFHESITWTCVCSSLFSARFVPHGQIFDTGGSFIPLIIGSDKDQLLGYLNSRVSQSFLSVINPTINYGNGSVAKLPWKFLETNFHSIQFLIHISKQDWDSFETSWGFQQLPLLGVRGEGLGVRECYTKMREQWIENTLKMQELEEENNRIFIEAYGLQDELSPDVPLNEITLTCNPYYRYQVSGDRCQEADVREFPINEDLEKRLLADTMKELISYAAGCMFGRYSLDKPGLILAIQGEGLDDYIVKVLGVGGLGVSGLGVRDSGSGEAALKPNTQNLKPSFMPDKDNVIPILDGEWFIDDIVSRFTDFLKVAYGTEKYSENISFIEEALGKDLRTYFMKDFYNDHVKRYKKRPIYWLFSSPKGSFNALIYMHRYTPDTVSILLNGYLREYIHKLRAKVTQLEHQLGSGSLSEREKMLTRKEIERLKDIISELEAWESKVILPLAEKRLEIDLDDGVKVNYGKFGEALKRC